MDNSKREPVSHTRKVAFRSCRRMHHLMYDLGVRPIREAIQLVVGNLLHAWLECWFRTQQTAASAAFRVEHQMVLAQKFLDGTADRATLAKIRSELQEGATELSAHWIPPGPPLVLGEEEYAERHLILEQWTKSMELGFVKLDASHPFEAARLRAMVLAYHIRWSAQTWDVLAVEPTFTAPLVNPWTDEISSSYERSGRLDLVVDDITDGGGEWAVEHKSHQGPLDPENDYWVKLRSDAQCSDYHIGARALGYEIAGIVYDVVCKPDIEPKVATPVDKRKYTKGKGCKTCGGKAGERGLSGTISHSGVRVSCHSCHGTGWAEAPHLNANQRERDETPGEYGMRCLEIMLAEPHRYLHRRPVVRLEKELESHEMDDWATVEMIATDKEAAYHPRNPDACFNWHSMCAFHPTCWGGISHTDTRLYQVRRKQQDPQPATIEEF